MLERVGLPTITQPMTGKSVEWNGWDLRVLRTYGGLAPHYEFFLPGAGLAKLWSCLRAAGADPVGVSSLEAFRIAEGIPLYAIDIAERTPKRRAPSVATASTSEWRKAGSV